MLLSLLSVTSTFNLVLKMDSYAHLFKMEIIFQLLVAYDCEVGFIVLKCDGAKARQAENLYICAKWLFDEAKTLS